MAKRSEIDALGIILQVLMEVTIMNQHCSGFPRQSVCETCRIGLTVCE